MHLFNKFEPGMKIDYISTHGSDDVRNTLAQVSNQGIAKGQLSFGAGALNAFQKAKQEAQGVRRRAVVDHVVDENTIRIMLCDTMEILWVSPAEIEPLDAVSNLADMLTSKSLKEQLREMEAEEKAQSDVRPKEHGSEDESGEAKSK